MTAKKDGRGEFTALRKRENPRFRGVTGNFGSGMDIEIADGAAIQELSNAFRRKNTGRRIL
ncbi:hypothetical protein D3C85_1655670 [compost metagenome]